MKYLKFALIFFIVFSLQGCVFKDPKYINFKSKPNSYYYSSILYDKLNSDEPFEIQVFDTNFSKYYDVNNEDSDILLSFLNSLSNSNYLKEAKDSKSHLFEISITFNDSLKEKFIINIFDENIVTVFPWDGNLEKDIISMENVSPYNNLYHFCTYIIDKTHSREYNQ